MIHDQTSYINEILNKLKQQIVRNRIIKRNESFNRILNLSIV